MSRRSFVRASFGVPLGLPLGLSLGGLGLSSETPRASEGEASSDASDYGHVRAKSIVVLWLWGGPSHIDMFDPKPDASSQYRGPFSTIPTRVFLNRSRHSA